MRRFSPVPVLIIAVLIIGVFSAGFAQENVRGTISGRVHSVGGRALPGASVEIINTQTAESTTVDAGDEGHFQISGLRSGKYRIVVKANGYQPKISADLELAAGGGQNVEFALKRQQPETPVRVVVPF